MCKSLKSFYWLLLLAFFFAQEDFLVASPSRGAPLAIYESELNSLISNMTELQNLYSQLEASSTAQASDLLRLQSELKESMKLLDSMKSELAQCRNDLMISSGELVKIRQLLDAAESSYRNLYESFLKYQKEAAKEIKVLKQDRDLWAVGAGLSIVLAVISFFAWLFKG